MYILSPQEMTAIDRHTINEYKIPGKLLMELAGKGCFEELRKILPAEAYVAVLCGKGNNGGDGLVIARWLHNYGYKSIIFLAGDVDRMSAETKDNYILADRLKIPIIQIKTVKEWQKAKQRYFDSQNDDHLSGSVKFTAYIDALFGIGFKGTLPPLIDDIITTVNQLPGLKLAIDISSGLNAANGQTEKAFYADYTYTMAAPKYGHIFGKGKDYSGKVEIIDIGVPCTVWQEVTPKIRLSDEKYIPLPQRFSSAHKGHFGKIAVIAGSQGYTGAAVLACRAALKSGAGLLTLFHPHGLETIFESSLTEIMTYSLDENKDKMDELLDPFDVILIGPGLGLSQQAVDLVDFVSSYWQKPIVYDADALNILSQNREWLNRLKDKPAILTPHIGEFSRLAGIETKDILQSPAEQLSAFTEKHCCSLLLKSSYRIYADENNMIIDCSGNDGLATGGSGDVLAGIIAGLLGQKASPRDASVSASILMGTTAESCSKLYETRAITPSLIIDNLFKKMK